MKAATKQVRLMGYLCDVIIAHYNNGRIAIQLIGAKGSKGPGDYVAVATVNIPQTPLGKGELILDSNNLPNIHSILSEAGIVGPVKRYAKSGFVSNYQIVDLLIEKPQIV